MKYKSTLLLLTSAIIISGCAPTGQIFGEHKDYFKNDIGAVTTCEKSIGLAGKPYYSLLTKSEIKGYLKKHNLPRSTAYFVCEGETPVLPKDCEGNSLTTRQLRKYWKKYDMPKGTIKFYCDGEVPRAKSTNKR